MTTKINSDTSDGLKITSDTSGVLDIQSAGTTKMTVGSTIDIQGNELVLDADADTSIHSSTDDRMDFKAGGSDTMHIKGTKVGIGNNDPDAILQVTKNTSSGATDEIIRWNHDASSWGVKIQQKHVAGSHLQWNIVDYAGNKLIAFERGRSCFGTDDPASGGSSGDHLITVDTNSTYQNGIVYVLHGNNNAGTFFTGSTTYAGAIGCSGSSTTYNTSSDYRLKENVNYSFDATNVIKSLKPCKFNFIGESETKTGFLAHEVSPYIEQAIHGTKDATKTYTDNEGNEQTIPDYQGIDLSQLVPTLVKTIQELEARITALES